VFTHPNVILLMTESFILQTLYQMDNSCRAHGVAVLVHISELVRDALNFYSEGSWLKSHVVYCML